MWNKHKQICTHKLSYISYCEYAMHTDFIHFIALSFWNTNRYVFHDGDCSPWTFFFSDIWHSAKL